MVSNRLILLVFLIALFAAILPGCSEHRRDATLEEAIASRDCQAVRQAWNSGQASASEAVYLLDHFRVCMPMTAARMLSSEDASALHAASRWLMGYGGRDYVPSRDDPAAVRLLDVLVSGTRDNLFSRKELLRVFRRIMASPLNLADPDGTVRAHLAHVAPVLGKDAEGLLVELFFQEASPGTALAALDSLVSMGLSDPGSVVRLFPGLFSTRQGVSWGPLVMAVLASSRGKARDMVLRVAEHSALHGRDYVSGRLAPPEFLADTYCRARAEGWGTSGLIENTMVRLLGMMRAGDILVKVLRRRYSVQALSHRWKEAHLHFLSRTGQPIRKHAGAVGTPSQLHDIEGYDGDVSIRQTVLDELSYLNLGTEDMKAGLSFGHDARIAMASAIALSRFSGPDVLGALAKAMTAADSWATDSSFFSTIREQALREALADGTVGSKIVELWNSTDKDTERWEKTASLWQPFADGMLELDGCEKDGRCALPTERLRESIMEQAWVAGACYAAKKLNNSSRLQCTGSTCKGQMPLSESTSCKPVYAVDASEITATPPIPQGASEDPEFALRPWSDRAEARRRHAVMAWIASRQNELKRHSRTIEQCKGSLSCLMKAYSTGPVILQRRILRILLGHGAGPMFMLSAFGRSRPEVRDEAAWACFRTHNMKGLCEHLPSPRIFSVAYLRLRLMCLHL